MRRTFIINLLILLSANFLVKPLWILGIDRTVQNTLGAADYGLYFTLFNLSSLFNIMLDLGINLFSSRAISRSPERLQGFIQRFIPVKAALALTFFTVYVGMAFALGYLPEHWDLVMVFGFNQVLLFGVLYLRTNLSALQLFKRDSLLSVFDRSMSIILCSIVIFFAPMGISISAFNFALIQGLSLLMAVLFGVALLPKIQWRWVWDSRFVARIFKVTWPFALHTVMMTIYTRVDAVMIERLLGPELGAKAAGIYAASFRLLDALVMVAYLMAGMLLPILSKMVKRRETTQQIIDLAGHLLWCFAWTSALLSLGFGQQILELLYVEASASWLPIFYMLMTSFVPLTVMYVLGALLLAHNQLRYLNCISISGFVLNFTGNALIIPSYGAPGAAAVSLATQLFVALAYCFVANKHTHWRLQWSTLKDALLFPTILALLIIGLIAWSPFDWYYNLTIALFAALVLLLIQHRRNGHLASYFLRQRKL